MKDCTKDLGKNILDILTIQVPRLDEIYSRVVRKYRETHNGSISGLSTEMNKLTDTGKTWEEAVLRFALDLRVAIPEVEKLINSGKSQEEAISTFSRTLETEEQIQAIYRPSQPSPTESVKTSPNSLWYLLPIFWGLLGGIIGYVGIKGQDKEMANNILNLGIIMTLIDIGIYYYIFFIWFPSIF